ncbi:hypothetical protein PR048_022853 [Dryococelus australis]|uniref:Uncharacterized protein n=1 Tax=Dryococelus australis TaxID=614101 RepID=A0ABQ9GSH3_9NEOP|nr:hypothetical protein PR048_022853 [Dryococelus australis]
MYFHWVIKHYMSSPYYSRGNQVEKFNKHLNVCLTIFYRPDHLRDRDLDFINVGFNSAVHNSIGCSPSLLFLGRSLTHPLPEHLEFASCTFLFKQHWPRLFAGSALLSSRSWPNWSTIVGQLNYVLVTRHSVESLHLVIDQTTSLTKFLHRGQMRVFTTPDIYLATARMNASLATSVVLYTSPIHSYTNGLVYTEQSTLLELIEQTKKMCQAPAAIEFQPHRFMHPIFVMKARWALPSGIAILSLNFSSQPVASRLGPALQLIPWPPLPRGSIADDTHPAIYRVVIALPKLHGCRQLGPRFYLTSAISEMSCVPSAREKYTATWVQTICAPKL